MLLEGGIRGQRLEFPLTLYKVEGFSRVPQTFENLDKLIIFISEIKNNKYTKEMKIVDICDEIGLYDTMTLIDERTEDIINKFVYYSSPATPPAPFDCKVWFDSVILLEQMKPRLF